MEDAGLRSARFRQEREAGWKALSKLVERVEQSGPRSLSFDEARELATLYRQTSSALAVARDISLDAGLLRYLEALTARAYLAVYAPQGSLAGLVSRFFRQTAPRALRRSVWYILLGVLALALGALLGATLYFEDQAWYGTFVPSGLAGPRHLGASTETLLDVIYGDQTDGLGGFATYLFAHNTRIAVMVFGLGAFLAAPAFMLTFYNGLIFGAFVALHMERGLGLDIFAWLSVHGVTELAAICIASGAGMMMGLAPLFPGERRRVDALFEASKDAVALALVAAVMLMVAALLEGFARQLVQSIELRLAIGWGVGALWLLWALLGGRRA
ncbi:MAG: stage II sporulation protein M [Pseudomonadota bacterium]